MSMASTFLGGAKDRLLPASIPFRFFISASVFHVLGWAALFLASDEVAGFRGGPGLTLAAIHLVTLGVLTLTAIGASYQLLPVVTRRPLARDWPPRLSFWLLCPGILLLVPGMGMSDSLLMKAGAALVCIGLAIFALVTADNLRRAGSVPVVSGHGWAAVAALVLVAVLGILLVLDFDGGFLDDHQALSVAHMTVAVFGFMGLLAIGFSLVLVPMFALSRSLPQTPGWIQLILTVFACAGFSFGIIFANPPLLWISVAAGFGAVGCYLWLMRMALKTGMRKRLGLSFLLIRSSWVMLVLGLLLAAGQVAGVGIPNAAALIGFVILVGWLLTFLTGVLQRIMPFLASMHAAGKSGLPPLLSDLTADQPLKFHAACHFTAFAACSVGVLMDQAQWIRIGAAIGTAGAVAFLIFALNIVQKLRDRAAPA